MKTTAAVLLFSSCLLFAQTPLAPAPPQSAVPPQIQQAQELNNEGKQAEALAILNQMLASDPTNYQANLNAGIVLDLMGDYPKARTHLDKAIEVAPLDRRVQALRTTAVSYAFQCELPQVTKYEQLAFDTQMKDQKFTDAAMNEPEQKQKDLWSFRWEHAQARIAARRGNKAEAQKHVEAAKAILDKGKIPDQQRFYPYLAGYLAFYAGDDKTAINQLLKADQKDPFILALLAQAYEKSGNQAEATKYYKQVLTINSHNPTNAFARPLAQKKLGIVSE